jgi:hypothetical protein
LLLLPQVLARVEMVSARNSRPELLEVEFAVLLAATDASAAAAGFVFELLAADVSALALGGTVASFVGLFVSSLPVALVAPVALAVELLFGWSDCGIVLALVELLLFIAVSLAEYWPFTRTRSPTWSAKLPENMLLAITGTDLSPLVRTVYCPLPALSRHPVKLSLLFALELLADCVVLLLFVL